MQIEALSFASTATPRAQEAGDQVRQQRTAAETRPAPEPEEKDIQPEEVLDRIKALTENGTYDVRFSKDERVDQLVISLVNPDDGKVIRQIPPEDLLNSQAKLREFRGNLLNATS